MAALELDGDEGPVEGKPPLLHLDRVVQGQHHLFQVAEIAVFLAVGNGGDEQAVGGVVVEHRGHLRDPVQPVRRVAEDIDGIRPPGKIGVVGDLEKVAQGEAQLEERVVEVDQDEQVTDARRVAQPVRGFDGDALEGVLLHADERTGPLVHGRLEDQGRIEEDLADHGHAAQLLVGSRAEAGSPGRARWRTAPRRRGAGGISAGGCPGCSPAMSR